MLPLGVVLCAVGRLRAARAAAPCVVASLLCLLGIVGFAGPALADTATVTTSQPSDGSRLLASPGVVNVWFSVVPQPGTSLTVTGPTGLVSSTVTLVGVAASVTVPLTLPNGRYVARYHALFPAGTSPLDGSVSFVVGVEPTPSPTPGTSLASAVSSPARTPAQSRLPRVTTPGPAGSPATTRATAAASSVPPRTPSSSPPATDSVVNVLTSQTRSAPTTGPGVSSDPRTGAIRASRTGSTIGVAPLQAVADRSSPITRMAGLDGSAPLPPPLVPGALVAVLAIGLVRGLLDRRARRPVVPRHAPGTTLGAAGMALGE